jgi:hypothetical protein
MFIEPESASWLLPEHDQPENIHLILIMLRWAFIAALAWGEYVKHGRGMAMMHIDDGGVGYCPGSPCECHREMVDRYDPEREVVVGVYREDDILNVYIVSGWPAPPDAYLITPAERFRLTAH